MICTAAGFWALRGVMTRGCLIDVMTRLSLHRRAKVRVGSTDESFVILPSVWMPRRAGWMQLPGEDYAGEAQVVLIADQTQAAMGEEEDGL